MLSTAKSILPHFALPDNAFYTHLEQLYPSLKNTSLFSQRTEPSHDSTDHSYSTQSQPNLNELSLSNEISHPILSNIDYTEQVEFQNFCNNELTAITDTPSYNSSPTNTDDEDGQSHLDFKTLQNMTILIKNDFELISKLSSKELSNERIRAIHKGLQSIIAIISNILSSISEISLTDRKEETYTTQIIPQRGLTMPKK